MDKQIMDDSEDDKNKAALCNLEMLPASSKETESELSRFSFTFFFFF